MINEPPREPSPQSLEQTTVLPTAIPTTDELPAVTGAPPPPNRAAARSSQPLLRAITAGAVVGIALIGVLLFVTSLGGDDVATQTSTTQDDGAETATASDQPEAVDEEPANDDSSSFAEGEPGLWQVAGVPDRLNVRSGPGTGSAVVGSLGDGDRNIAGTGRTADVNGSQWTEIVYGDDETGWVSARFLRSDVASDTPTSDTDSETSARGSRVCFSSNGDPRQVARIDFSNHTGISGMLMTLFAAAPITEQIGGTLVDGQAEVTLTNTANGDSRRMKWNFTPASIRSGSNSPLAVVDCGSIEELLG